jgi:peroxiredoxin Q/BCP
MTQTTEKAPLFTAVDQDSKRVSLDQYNGQNVVLFFYPKDNTPGCTLEAKDFTALQPEFASLNTVIIGVSKDSVSSHQNFCQKQAITLTLLSDPDMKLIEPYGVWQEKKNYGKTYMGIVRTTVLINQNGEIEKRWNNVRAKGHAQRVLDTVKALNINQS